MKAVHTLIVMASESRIRLARNDGVGKGVSELLLRDSSEFGDMPHGYADVPGRGQAAPGGVAGHKFERPTSERDQRRHGFAAHVIETARGEWQQGGYDRLILAATPKMLGALRSALPEPLAKALVADLDKDLTKVPVAELPDHLSTVLAV